MKRKCLGFGEFERKCENEAGSAWGPYWCQRCDELRMNHISARFDEIEKRLGEEGIHDNV